MKNTVSLRKNYEFARVYRRGKHHKSRNLTLYVLENGDSGKRLGITVSRKSYGRSVDRNRARRLVRESYRIFEEGIAKNKDMVFVIRKNNKVPSFDEIRDETEYLLKKSGLIKSEKQ